MLWKVWTKLTIPEDWQRRWSSSRSKGDCYIWGIILRKRLLRREMFTPDPFISLPLLCILSLTRERCDFAKWRCGGKYTDKVCSAYKRCSRCGRRYGSSLKSQTGLPSDPASPFLGIWPKGSKAEAWTDTCPSMFIAALVTAAQK